MIYAFTTGVMCGPVNKPSVKLVYLYIKVYNASPSAPYIGNRTIVSFTAEIAVKNRGPDTIRLSKVALSLPEYLSTIHEGGPGTYTVTLATTVPGGQATIAPSVTGHDSFVGALFDVLNYSRQVSYSIPPGKELRLVITGASLVSTEWEGKLISSWLHGGRWAYMVTIVSVEACGATAASTILTNATLTEAGPSKYYYASGISPELISSSKTAELIQP